MAISIRTAGPDDVPQLAAVGRQAFLDAYAATAAPADLERHVDTCFSASAIRLEMLQSTVAYGHASDGPSCAGMIKLRDDEGAFRLPSANAMEVQQLYVATAYQRQGVGGHLMNYAIRTALGRGKAGLWLSAWRKADWATAFYRRHGFETLGEIPFLLGETEYTDYLMWLPLEGVPRMRNQRTSDSSGRS